MTSRARNYVRPRLQRNLTPPQIAEISHTQTNNNRIRRVQFPGGFTTTLAGGAAGYVDGVGDAARFSSPRKGVVDPTGLALVVADFSNNAVRWIVIATALVSTLAGGNGAGNVVGPALLARLNGPSGVAFSPSGATLFIADQANNQVKAFACSAPSPSPSPTPLALPPIPARPATEVVAPVAVSTRRIR